MTTLKRRSRYRLSPPPLRKKVQKVVKVEGRGFGEAIEDVGDTEE